MLDSLNRTTALTEAIAPLVLVIDQDASILELLRDVLQEEGYRVTVAHSRCPKTWPLLRRALPELVLLDLQGGCGSGGLNLLNQIQEDANLHGIPVICMSAEIGSRRDEVRARAQRCAGFVSKPFDLDELLDLVAAAVEPAAQPR